jgi:hypothetical protein
MTIPAKMCEEFVTFSARVAEEKGLCKFGFVER